MNVPKILVLAVLSWCLLVAWYGNNGVVPSLVATDMPEVVTPVMLLKATPVPVIPPSVSANKKPLLPPLVKPETKKEELVWKRLASDFQLDHHTETARVKAEIRKLLADQSQFYQILKAAGPYIYYILEQTQSRGLPAEMALVPLIESEFNPNNRSHIGALGLWQLMRGTANVLGVKVTSGYDGRRNVVYSTHAALLYLRDLGKNFKGNWYLALAAYNTGQGNVQSAIRRTGSNSYWNLPLAKETRLYVPKLLAVAAIINHPEKYGIKLPPINNEPFFVELKLTKSVSLEKIAKTIGIQLDTLRLLNPDYKQGAPIPKKGAYTLLIPVEHEKQSVPI